MNLSFFLHQTFFGGVAAAGFAVLFNVPFRLLPWCAASGAAGLAVRTCCLGIGWSLEGASFAAGLTIGAAAYLLRARQDFSLNVFDVVGCIPLVPGSLAAKAIVGLFAVTTGNFASDSQTLITTTAQYTLRVAFTTGAIGTGLAVPTLLLRLRKSV
jgi:uncharacterized membrane protein YjjB (DUF3815 family)